MNTQRKPNEKPSTKQCAVCNATFKTARTFKRHIAEPYCTRAGKAQCGACGVYFAVRGMRTHQRSCPKIARPQTPEEVPAKKSQPLRGSADELMSITQETLEQEGAAIGGEFPEFPPPFQSQTRWAELEIRLALMEGKLESQTQLEEARQMDVQAMTSALQELNAVAKQMDGQITAMEGRLLMLRSKLSGHGGWLRWTVNGLRKLGVKP
jgi:hypothetical protein